jgi:hypothetical protein
MTIEDPGTFTQPMNIKYTGTLIRGELMEFVCMENNQYGVAGVFRPGTVIGNAPLENK